MKYRPLEQFLLKQTADKISMRFDEIETLIGEKLPSSAYRHRPWWANEERGHSHAKAWLAANYETAEVDMKGKKLSFVSVDRPRHPVASSNAPASKKGFVGHHPMIGALKALIKVEAGHDLTSPALPDWADNLDSTYGSDKQQ